MLNRIPSYLYNTYIHLTRSIAFLPAIVAFIFTLFAFLMIYIEQFSVAQDFQEEVPWLDITSEANARAILTAILTGVISLTVFSFSMVMIVLNQASSRITPKVVGGLVSNKSNQFILGVYIGTIVYTLIVLLNIRTAETFLIPSLAIIMGAVLAIICISLFVKFIHDVSQSIQVINIIKYLYKDASRQLKKEEQLIEQEPSAKDYEPEEEEWVSYLSTESGYLQAFADDIIDAAKKHDVIVRLKGNLGQFIIKGMPLFYVNKQLDVQAEKKFRSFLKFHIDERISENVLYGFRQIADIAVKSLSPGINDPSIAIIAIDHLGALMAAKMSYREKYRFFDNEKNLRLVTQPVTLRELLVETYTPVRTYGKLDVFIMARLLRILQDLAYLDRDNQSYKAEINEQATALVEDVRHTIKNSEDRQFINNIAAEMNGMKNNYFQLELLNNS